jgi:putative FmdB family regulatory protein
MPLYEYECDACGQRFELIQKFSDPSPDACTLCGKGPVRRLQSSPAIQFKGSGWYITDYAQKGRAAPDTASGDKADKSESAKTDGEKTGKAEGEKKEATKSDSKKTETTSSSAAKPASEN